MLMMWSIIGVSSANLTSIPGITVHSKDLCWSTEQVRIYRARVASSTHVAGQCLLSAWFLHSGLDKQIQYSLVPIGNRAILDWNVFPAHLPIWHQVGRMFVLFKNIHLWNGLDSYILDAYTKHAALAIAANTFVRSFFGCRFM